MHRWVGLVCHPQQPKGSIDRKLQPPPPCDDLPSLLKYRVWILITIELDSSSADPIQLCAHIADHSISLFCHLCVDRSGSRSIPRLRNAKNADASKDNRRPSRHRSADSSSGELSAQSESSTQYPCTQEYDEQDVERPNRQLRLRRVHP